MLWIWLSSITSYSRNISWADCEDAMGCCTKARRNCLIQLVEEGFVSVQEDGVVVLHDPYEAFQNNSNEDIIPLVKKEYEVLSDEAELELVDADTQDVENNTATLANDNEEEKFPELNETKPEKQADKKTAFVVDIIQTWNKAKPDSYSKIRTLSGKQLEAVNKHLKNLNLKQSDIVEFLTSICKGIERSDFWSNKVDANGRNFSAVFGYGNPQDVKLKNVENLYILGSDEVEAMPEAQILNDDQKELIKTYRYISFELDKAKNRNKTDDMNTWQEHLDVINQKLAEQNIVIEPS